MIPVISSCIRPENYIKRTINTIGNIPLMIFVNGNDSNYLTPFLSNNISVNLNPPIDKNNKLLNQFFNYKYCLEQGYNGVDKGILLIEDDIIFCKNWKKRFDTTILELEILYKENFILSLFTNLPLCNENNIPDSHYLPIPKNRFRGTQGMYYPNKIRLELINFFNNYDKNKIIPYDLIIKQYLIDNPNINIFSTLPCLVQHIGKKSSWHPSPIIDTAIIYYNEI